MATISRLSQDHQAILSALEVLRLMTDRIEDDRPVDVTDVDTVLRFFRDVGRYCLDNVEKSLLVPAMAYTAGRLERDRVDATVATHHHICELLLELEGSLQTGWPGSFVPMSRRFTSALGDLIYFEHHQLCALLEPFLADGKNGQWLEDFDRAQRQLAEQGRQLGSAMRSLEMKYVAPHCI
jgi:hypothetical protein